MIANRQRVLIVDDDADTAWSLRAVLEQRGYDCQVCLESKDCMAIVETLRPSAILMDLAMPGMSGFDIADELREHADLQPTVLVAISGYSDETFVQRAREKGFHHHLVKPCNLDDLEKILKSSSGSR